MERRNEDSAGMNEDRLISPGGEHLRPLTGALKDGSADEHRMEPTAVNPNKVDVGLERFVLAAVRVAPHSEVKDREGSLTIRDFVGQNDRPGAGSENRHPICDSFSEVVAKLEPIDELDDCGRFASRDYQRVRVFEVGLRADFKCSHSEVRQGLEVFYEVAL